ncbi:MAG: DNA-binding protein [Verrucomicrobia bacterium]|nr:DNA-binding protein [Verrucomicrobiota bacterium]
MKKDLTTSEIDRQNILNNPYALKEIEKAAGIQGIPFEGRTVLLKEQVASFFEITPRTVDNYLEKNGEELKKNGYALLKGKSLKSFKLALRAMDVHETDFANITKSPQLGVFDFRAFLNLAMLMTESHRAGLVRSLILDIVIDTINRRTGGGTKYINQRDEDFIHSSFIEDNYRKQFAAALKDCVAMGNFKYAVYTDRIYVSIFKEESKEYRKILSLHEKDKVQDTFYSEVLDLIASYECGFAEELRAACTTKGRMLTAAEVDALFRSFETLPHWRPLIEKARNKMASRDLAFRDALHLQLSQYVTPLPPAEFERFIGEKSMELSKRLEQAKDVMKRLKERE